MSCRDLYGAKLEIGDRVIGVISTTSGVSGTITNIIEDDSVSYMEYYIFIPYASFHGCKWLCCIPSRKQLGGAVCMSDYMETF